MIIDKKRIRNTSSLSIIKNKSLVRFGVSDINRFLNRCIEIGFTNDLKVGETVLPLAKIGPVSRRNAEGLYLPDRTKEMETAYATIEWTWKQFAGKDDTIEVTEFRDRPYKRYPRKFIPPQSLELTVVEDEAGEKLILTPEIEFIEDNNNLLIHSVNLILEIFGECQFFTEELNTIMKTTNAKRINWETLPKGKTPWKRVNDIIEPIMKNVKKGSYNVILHRFEALHKKEPDFFAYGKAGFFGYVVFGYQDRGLYILESIYNYNATYVLDKDWEELSQLTKAEILNNDLHKERIIHTKVWDEKISKLIA